MRIARSTPAQNPRGAAISRSIFRRGDTVSMTVIGHVLMRSLVAGEPASYDAIDNCQKGMPDGCLAHGTLARLVSHISHSTYSRSRSDPLPEEPDESEAEPAPTGVGSPLYGGRHAVTPYGGIPTRYSHRKKDR